MIIKKHSKSWNVYINYNKVGFFVEFILKKSLLILNKSPSDPYNFSD